MRGSGNRFCGAVIIATLAVGGLGLVREAAAASISGFSNFTFNSNGYQDGIPATPPTLGIDGSNTTLTLTSLNTNGLENDEDNSAFYNSTVPVGNFTVSFIYTMTSGSGAAQDPADGFTFVIQNAGVNALGGYGGGLGYSSVAGTTPLSTPPFTGITPSVAVEFNLYKSYVVGTNIAEDGGNTSSVYNATGSVSMDSQDPILVQLSYSSATQTLTETLTDETTLDMYTTSYDSLDIPTIVGGSNAYVGFTGSDGAGTSTQVISAFTFSNAVPLPPAAWSGLILLCGLGVVRRART